MLTDSSGQLKTAPPPPRHAAIIVDANDNLLYSFGLEADPQLQELMRKPDRISSLRNRRIFSITTKQQSYLGVAALLDQGACALLIQPCAGEDELIDFVLGVDFSFDILNKLVSSPFDGMTVVDTKGRIVFLSRIHEKFFGLARGEAFGRHVSEVIENSRLDKVVHTGTAEIAQVQHMHGTSRIVSRVPITRKGEIVGAVGRVMFKGPDQLIKMIQELNKLKTEIAYYKRENHSLRTRTYGLDQIIGSGAAIRKLKSDLARVAGIDVPVLIVGESGTGKELVAQAIHWLSLRRDNPMVMVNAAALPENLVESELFGYESGAFTGAQRGGRRGKFEAAHDSTLFLDEIGDMPLDVQVKVLRVLQDGSFERVGSDKPCHTDFRLITATNRPINSMVDQGAFRLDLYYRISGVVIHVPPLRDRLDDIPELVQHFMASFVARHRLTVRRIDPKVFTYLQQKPWPGNVRQLLHEVERALIFCDGPTLTVRSFEALDMTLKEPGSIVDLGPPHESTLKDALERVEVVAIKDAMVTHKGNKKKAAESLGISRSYLYKRLEELPTTDA